MHDQLQGRFLAIVCKRFGDNFEGLIDVIR